MSAVTHVQQCQQDLLKAAITVTGLKESYPFEASLHHVEQLTWQLEDVGCDDTSVARELSFALLDLQQRNRGLAGAR